MINVVERRCSGGVVIEGVRTSRARLEVKCYAESRKVTVPGSIFATTVPKFMHASSRLLPFLAHVDPKSQINNRF